MGACYGRGSQILLGQSIAASCSGWASHPQVCAAAAEASPVLRDELPAPQFPWIQKGSPCTGTELSCSPTFPMVRGGSKGRDPPCWSRFVTAAVPGEGQAWHVRWHGGRRASPPCHRVPLFLTRVSVRMVHAALCNADADEGKVPFCSPCVSGFPLPPCHPHPASVSPCVTINRLPPPPSARVSVCLSAVWLCHPAGTRPHVGWLRASEVPG